MSVAVSTCPPKISAFLVSYIAILARKDKPYICADLVADGVWSNGDLAILRKSNSWSSAQANRKEVWHRKTDEMIRIIPHEWHKSYTLSWLQQLDKKKSQKDYE